MTERWSEKTLGKRTNEQKYGPAHKKFQKRIKTDDLFSNEFLGAKLAMDSILTDQYTRSTKIRDLGSLVRLCRANGLETLDPWHGTLVDTISKLSAEESDHISKNQLDRSDQHWRSWDSIESLLASLDSAVVAAPDVYRQQQQRLLLQLYVYHPPWRHNFHHVPIVTTPLEPHQNYIQKQLDGKWNMHLGYDKTVDVYGPEDRVLDDRIGVTLDDLETRFGPRAYLLTRSGDRTQPLDECQPIHCRPHRLLSTIPNADGTPSGLKVDLLRSAYATRHNALADRSLADKQQLARSMRTSHQMIETYYYKIQPNKNS